jgi:hypothetical protein
METLESIVRVNKFYSSQQHDFILFTKELFEFLTNYFRDSNPFIYNSNPFISFIQNAIEITE